MVYQRSIPQEEMFCAQLELLMQNARGATVAANLAGVAAACALFWSFVELPFLLGWATACVLLFTLRSIHMGSVLSTRQYLTAPRLVYWHLIVGAALTGSVWSAAYIYTSSYAPQTVQYVFLLVIVMVVTFSVGVTVVIREYFVATLFTSVWPVAWWILTGYWGNPENVMLGVMLLLLCALLITMADRIYQSYHNMIATNWEREAIAVELSDLTGSLRDRNRQLRDARRQLTDLANVDELTGLGNRRLVNTVLLEEINRARRAGGVISVILLDVDYFKNYNDTYGHPAGDAVLQQLADLMQRATARAGEVVGRYGGEEFIIVMPGATAAASMRTATRLKELVSAEAIPHSSSEVASHITISQGVVTVSPDGDLDGAELIKMADTALYRAKGSGRNAIAVG
jgi:diguanylate cyclase (GGDEF)-like protein